MARNPGNFDVYVVYDAEGAELRVIPPVAVVSKNLSIRNMSGFDVEVSCGGLNIGPTTIGDGKHDSFAANTPGFYPYLVTATVNGSQRKARGASDPKVIVDA
jgi:hypothetical protein